MSSYDCLSGVELSSVSDINAHIKVLLEGSSSLKNIWISGELTNVKFYQHGQQLYFTLSDGQSQLNAVVYSQYLQSMTFEPKNGQSVVIKGAIKHYHKKGRFILQVYYMAPKGIGDASLKLAALKKKLLKEGLFDQDRKKVVPHFPEKIALITALDSAAMWDYLSTTRVLAPHIKVTVIPAVMQGEYSSHSIQMALQMAEDFGGYDCVLLLRGGGSSEDLSSFNDESLVRRISDFSIPLISAIGHEVDYSLVDFVSDYRVSTPTAAAEFISKPISHFKGIILAKLESCLNRVNATLDRYYELVFERYNTSNRLLDHQINLFENKVALLTQKLELLNPLRSFNQGFSICYGSDHNYKLTSIKESKPGDKVNIRLIDGYFNATIDSIKKEDIYE
ncbi:exodeoxyribonuclease VII large subunit [Candidatus Marinamargulisbacteria bacterium SCGC AG-410-N11]|nr:exodeoxyribonuclease VII large subunit [Candidatus Marinamargulisbacteria bacterium SCGC AG-410-N11]